MKKIFGMGEMKQTTKILPVLALLTVALATAACSNGVEPADTTIRWRAQAGVPASSWLYQAHFMKFAELVNERSQGRLEIQIFPPRYHR